MKELTRRLILIMAVFIILLTAGIFFLYRSYSALNEELVSRTSLVLARAVEETLTNAADKNLEELTPREKRRLRSLMNSMTTETGSIIHILLINDKMKILLSSDKSIEGHIYRSAEELQKLHSRQPQVLPKTLEGGIEVLDVIVPLWNRQGEIFSYLRMVLSHKELVNFYKDITPVFLPIILLLILIIGFSLYSISRSYRRPLESVKNMASRLDKGDYSYRIDYSKKDEYTNTFQQLNKTIEKVGLLSESYKKAEKQISRLLKAVDESIVMLNEKKEIISYNEAAAQIFSCAQDSSFKRCFKEIYSQNMELKQLISEAVKNKEQAQLTRDLVIWLADGSDLLLRVSVQIFREAKQGYNILLTFKDVRRLDELQNNLQRSMKFGVIANLASSISHEIKNPLSAMAIHTEILNNRLPRLNLEDQGKINKSLSVLQNEVKRLNRIINQFFNLARIKKNDLQLININSVIKDVLLLVQQQAIERNILLEQTLDNQLDFIYGDADQLKQVLLNIVLNAFQAIERGGRIKISSRMTGRRVLVDIVDNGQGMSAEVQQHVFDLYYTTKKDGGGIGLAVSKNIMEAHEGLISFESSPGQGTRFLLDFPRKDHTTQLNIPAPRRI